MALCYLCRIPEIDNTYANLLDFDSVNSLKNFISNRTIYNLGDYNIKYDGNIPVIDVQKPYDTLLQIDYLYMIKDNIYTCYFVIKKEMHASNITRLYLELDVWMTNMHKVEFMTCFIDRCHVHRWTQEGYPTKEIVSEPVALGVDVVDGIPTQKARTDNGVYIYITSSPVGAVTQDKSSGGGSDEPSGPSTGCGDPEQGIPTPNGFVFIKGYEGLAQYAYDIGDGHQTIGYGCTQANWPTYFNQLVNNQPVSERLASEVFASLLITEFGLPLASQLQSDGILNNISGDQFSALLSFAYNAGLGSLRNAAFYDLIVQGDYDTACTYWLTTNILPGTQFEEGLRARRQAEVNIFKNGVYDLRTITIYGASGNVTGTVTENDGKGYIPSIIANTCSQGGDYNYFEDGDGNLWSLPLEKGWTSALFGSYPNNGGAHYGIDFTWQTPGAIQGANIYAPNDNMTVVFAGWNSGGFGNMVKLYDSVTDTYHIFGHMNQTPSVSTGDTVNRKTVLGYVGTTGNSSGYHLHWEIRKGVDSSSNAINPIANSELYTWYYRKGDGN